MAREYLPANISAALWKQSKFDSPFVHQRRVDGLIEKLFAEYNHLSPPVPSNGNVLQVGVGMDLIQLLKLDVLTGTISMLVKLRLCWADERLRYNARDEFPERFGSNPGNKIAMAAERLWTPDVTRVGLRGGGGVGMGVSGMVFVGLVLGGIEAKFCK